MNWKRFFLASLAVFAVFRAGDYIIHGIILAPTYQSLAEVWRPDMQSYMWILTVVGVFFALLFTFIFTRGYESKGPAEGLRYGLLIGLLLSGAGSFQQYVVYPIPLSLALQWFGFGMVEFLIAGLLAASIYKGPSRAD